MREGTISNAKSGATRLITLQCDKVAALKKMSD
jgi:hypothetical protein